MNNTQKLSAMAALLLALTTFSSCKKDEKTAEENITTIEVHLTGTGFDKKFFWNDTDGDGVANTIDEIQIPANTGNIQAHLHVYDRSVTPEIDLTEEIEEESTEHLFTYAVTGANLTIANLNTDSANNPFGITSVWTTAAAGSGSVNIKLYHEPTNKTNATNPGGEVDFDVVFPVKIQ